MSTSMVPFDFTQLPSTQIGTDDQFAALAKSGEFIGRLQLFTKGKAINKGLIKPGHYGIPESGDDIIDLTDSVDILPLCRKPKAIDMSDKEAIVVSYDPDSSEFQRIQATAQEKESNCMYGPSFLVFERVTGRFLEFFCGSKSTRGEAAKIFPYLPLKAEEIAARGLVNKEPHGPLGVTLQSRLVEKGSYSWHVPVIKPCSTPFPNFPKMELVVREMTRFLTIKSDDVQKVDESGKKARAR